MKKWIIVALILISAMADAWAGSLILVTGEWTPYTSKTLEKNGFFTEIVSEVCKEMDLVPEYEFHSWRDCFSMVEKGTVMGAFPYTYTDERAVKVFFSEKIVESNTVFFKYGIMKMGSHSTLKDLKKLRIGGVTGYFYEDAFKKLGLDINYAPDEKTAIENLKVGNYDLVVMNELVGWHVIKKDFSWDVANFKTLDSQNKSQKLKLIVSKKHPGSSKFVNKFNRALKKVKKGEKWKSIQEKYSMGKKK